MALLLYVRDHQLPSSGGAILLSPWVDTTASLGSWDSNAVSFFYVTFFALADSARSRSAPRLPLRRRRQDDGSHAPLPRR